MDILTGYIGIIIIFDGALKYGYDAKFFGYVETKAEPLCV
jgi:hypothetical protein